MRKVKSILRLFGQRALVTAGLFGRNELANHASAGAYGFLLSSAPAVLLAAVLVARAFSTSPDGAARILDSIDILGSALDTREIARGFLSAPMAGLSGIIALANLVWTARVFALSIQGGIRVVFADPPGGSPVRSQLLTFAIEGAALLYLLAYALSVRYLGAAAGVLGILETVFVTYAAYRYLPRNKPSRKSAAEGAVLCALAFAVVAFAFRRVVNLSRYDLVYGVLGGLIVALANVYFFFTFFFLGAQLAFVSDSFDSLVFSRLRRIRAGGGAGASPLEKKLFSAPERLISKYARTYAVGETLFARGERGEEVYFVLDGEIAITLDGSAGGPELAVLGKGSIFGEMAYLLSEPRTAWATAKTEATVLVLPPALFDRLLKEDTDTARDVIDSLSSRLKGMNERWGRPSSTGSGAS
jgi:membrane protein